MTVRIEDVAADAALAPGRFRELMRRIPAAVTIIAAGMPGERSGLTATAVCPVSDDPPTLLACINRSASSHEAIVGAGSFSINVLSAADEALATCFAGRTGATGEAKFEQGVWSTHVTGAPVLTTALVAFDCELVDIKDVASHSIVFGRVVAGRASLGGEPLLYVRGSFWMPAG